MSNKEIQKVRELVANLCFDHQRMSSSGQYYYEELCKLLNIEL